MITVHHLENSQSIRILWLMEEIGVDYEIQYYKRDRTSSLAPEEYKNLHLVGTAPIISDGDLVLPETNAIADYIVDKHSDAGLRPEPNTSEYIRYLYWFHAAQGSLMPVLLMQFIFNRIKDGAPFLIRPVVKVAMNTVEQVFLRPRLEKIFSHIEGELSHSTWFAGEQFTAADIIMGYCMEMAFTRDDTGERYPKSVAYIERMRARPGYIAAMKKNDSFQTSKA